jgi:hypothetical protein
MRLRSVLLSLALLCVGLAVPRSLTADVASDHPAAILVFPKILVDTTRELNTLIRLSNVSDTSINVYCFYVNATPQCSLGLDTATSCFPNKLSCFADVGGTEHGGECQAKWQETDFLIRLTQDQPTGWLVSEGESVNCTFIDGLCSNDGTTRCDMDADCGPGNRCVQPPCLPLFDGPFGRTGPNGQVNEGAIPPSPEDPFIGELKCIAMDESLRPVSRNDLKGEVLIGSVQRGPDQSIDLAGYNAIGIPALVNSCQTNNTCSLTGTTCQVDQNCTSTNNRDNTLVIGGPPAAAEYEGCPNILILDHFFDGAADPLINNFCQLDGTCSVSGVTCLNDNDCFDNLCLNNSCTVTGTACLGDADCLNTCDIPTNICTLSGEHCLQDADCTAPTFQTRVVTELTLVPCTEDFENQRPDLSRTTVQFLVFNEFEQRFSTSTSVECFKETRLSDINGSLNQNDRSIFSVGVEGTLTGQTRIRGVVNDDPKLAGRIGNALLGVAEEFRCSGPKYQFPLCNFVDDRPELVSAAAKNLHFQGRRPQADFIYLPQQ